MGTRAKIFECLAAGGGLAVLTLVASCGSSESEMASAEASKSVPTGIASGRAKPGGAKPDMANPASAEPPAPLPGATPASDTTLCQATEIPLFSCEVGAKRVSICRRGTRAVYRYGTPGKVELTSRSLTFANREYSGGGESQITARNADYTYTVYDSTVRTAFGESGNEPEFSSGLVISRAGQVMSSRSCKVESMVEADAGRVLPAGSFIDH